MPRNGVAGAFSLMGLAFLSVAVSAQVMIDMPPASPRPASSVPDTSTASNPDAASAPEYALAAQSLSITAITPLAVTTPMAMTNTLDASDLGDVALSRYSRGRISPIDVYSDRPRYAGIRYYSDPISYGYNPFFFWWGGHGVCH